MRARTVLMGQVLCLFLVLLPIVAYNVWTEGSFYHRGQSGLTMGLARALASRQTTLASSTESLLISMSLAPVVRSGNAEKIYEFIAQVDRQQPDYEGFAVFDLRGETVAGLYDGRPRQIPAGTIRQRPYFQAALNAGGFNISTALLLDNNRMILPMTMPIKNPETHELTGFIMATVSMTRQRDIMRSMTGDDNASVVILDSSFKPIYIYNAESLDASAKTAPSALLLSQDLPRFIRDKAVTYTEDSRPRLPPFELTDDTGRVLLGAAVSLQLHNAPPYMYIVVMTEQMPWGIFLTQRYMLQFVATMLVLLFAVLFSARLGTRFFSAGLERLAEVAVQSHEGNLSHRCGPVQGCREIQVLGRSFDHMLDELERNTTELYHLSLMDPLTGIWNRRHFTETVRQEIALAARQKYPVVVVMSDIDHFKRVNDTFGHATGDIVLQQFAMALRVNIRVSDILARYGGEEFILFLPATSAAGAATLLEKLRSTTEALRVTSPDGRDVRFTASFGAAYCIPDSGTSEAQILDTLQIKADAALYASKAAGRNRVTLTDAIDTSE